MQKINPQKEENFQRPKTAINAPRFTTKPPQINHQKTTFCTSFSAKPPAKTTKTPSKK
jgi:hypothetical protein